MYNKNNCLYKIETLHEQNTKAKPKSNDNVEKNAKHVINNKITLIFKIS